MNIPYLAILNLNKKSLEIINNLDEMIDILLKNKKGKLSYTILLYDKDFWCLENALRNKTEYSLFKDTYRDFTIKWKGDHANTHNIS